MVATESTIAAVTGRRGKKAKQADLPAMEDHQRKIAEIEDAADELIELEDRLSSIKNQRDDAMDNLVASMKRHDRTLYERQTWGKVILKESKTKATVKKATLKSAEGDGEAGDSDAED